MRIVPLDASTLDAWNAIAGTSPDAWFWHTPEWLAFVKAIGASAFVADLSSLIYVDREPTAICPVILEDRGGYRRFTYLGEFLPFPAFRPGAGESLRGKALECYAAWLAQAAARHDVAYTRVVVPTLAESAAAPRWNPLLRSGYMDIAMASQIVALDADVETLWRDLRKGHRSDVKRAADQCDIAVWDASSITGEAFDRYRELHALDAGRVTRSSETFDMMLSWIRGGRGVLVEARASEAAVAFALIVTFRGGAYYASSCRHPGIAVPAMHLVQWEAMKWLKAHGVRRYDLGMQYFGPSWTHVPSAKELSIAAFKRGFGGATRRIDAVERFYSPAVLARVAAERVQALSAAGESRIA